MEPTELEIKKPKQKYKCTYCDRMMPRITGGLCAACYARYRRNGSPAVRKNAPSGSIPKKRYIPVEKPKHYLSNMDLYKELVTSLAMGKLSTKAVNMFYLITKNVVRKFRYNDQDRDDAIQASMERLLTFWYSFNPEKGDNAFAYVSEVIKRALAAEFNLRNEIKQNGNRIRFVSLEGFDDDGNSYDRF